MIDLASPRWRYIAVSGVCALANNVILVVGDHVGLPLLASIALSYACVVVLGYCAHARFTFSQPWGLGAFLRYALAMAANIPVFAAMVAGLHALRVPMWIAAPTATLAMLAVNYILAKWAVTGAAAGERQDKRNATWVS